LADDPDRQKQSPATDFTRNPSHQPQFGAIAGPHRYAVRKMTESKASGVVLIAHGTVTNLDEMEGFLTAIRRGRVPSAQLVEEMQRRYRAIGGSPLIDTTNQQARALAQRLGIPVLVGMRFSQPSIEQALAEAARQGLTRLVVVPMAPYSVQTYFDEVCARSGAMMKHDRGDQLELLRVASFGTQDDLVRAHAQLIRRVAGPAIAEGASVVLSAHSLPMRVIELGDRYGVETRQCAEAIGASLGIGIELAYQSQGADGGNWLGPDLADVVNRLADSGTRRVVVAPFGFLCDHVETLFDLDIELRARTDDLGIELVRVPTLGLDSAFIEVLAHLVEQVLRSSNPEHSIWEAQSC
jgi:ferrochelatase